MCVSTEVLLEAHAEPLKQSLSLSTLPFPGHDVLARREFSERRRHLLAARTGGFFSSFGACFRVPSCVELVFAAGPCVGRALSVCVGPCAAKNVFFVVLFYFIFSLCLFSAFSLCLENSRLEAAFLNILLLFDEDAAGGVAVIGWAAPCPKNAASRCPARAATPPVHST